MNAYIDSSAILRVVLGQPDAFGSWSSINIAATSQLAWAECCRVTERLRLEQKLDDGRLAAVRQNLRTFFSRLHLFEVNSEVVEGAAGSFPTVIGTLDAIHLHTAILWKSELGADVTMVTHDNQLNIAAQATGLLIA